MESESPARVPAPVQSTAGQDRVLVSSRILSALIVPVLVAAFIILYLSPNQTGSRFAWPIKPPMSAMMLGATYLGGAYFFTRAALARCWQSVQLGFLPVTAFAAIMGVSTILHWDKFSHGKFAFELWALLYFALPFVIPLVWYANQRLSRRATAQPAQEPFSRPLRLAFGVLGAVLLVASAILLLFPAAMIPLWPWPLTSLTARAMAAQFTLPGLVGILVALDGRWSSASIIFQAQAFSVLLFLVAIVLTRHEINWRLWSAWTFLGGLLLVLVLLGLAIIGSRKR